MVAVADIKILIVDDVFIMRKVIKRILTQIGYFSFDEAENGKIAWEKILNAYESGVPYNLIISDVNMPEITGHDLLQNMRSDQNFKNIPFLMITAESERDSVIEAINMGVTDFILKPFTPDMLKEKINHIFNI